MNNTVLYCRTANGGMDAIKSQLQTLSWFGKAIGYTPAAAYCDCNESGATLDRPCMQKLLTDIRAGEVKRVIVRDLSRLSRHLLHSNELVTTFNKYGVELISMNDGGLMDLGFAEEISDVLLSLVGKKPNRRKCG